MPSQKVRKQMIFVNACRRRLKRMLVENGVTDDLDGNGGPQEFSAMLEEFRITMESVKEVKDRADQCRTKRDGEAARTRQELNTELRRARTILNNMSASLAGVKEKIRKAEKKGNTETEKYAERRKEVEMKESIISQLRAELEKLEWVPEMKMNAQQEGRMDDAQGMLRALRMANKRRDVMGGAGGQAEEGQAEGETDPDFEAGQRELEKNRREQEEILKRIGNGLAVLKERTINIGNQIDQSNKQLEGLEHRAADTNRNLKMLNRSTLNAINEASNQSYFTNIACFLLLIALAGVAVYYLDLV